MYGAGFCREDESGRGWPVILRGLWSPSEQLLSIARVAHAWAILSLRLQPIRVRVKTADDKDRPTRAILYTRARAPMSAVTTIRVALGMIFGESRHGDCVSFVVTLDCQRQP